MNEVFDGMPGLSAIQHQFAQEHPLQQRDVLLHLHITKETAALGACLVAGGARVSYLPSNKTPSPPEILERIQQHGGRLLENISSLDTLVEKPASPIPAFVVVEGSGGIFQLVQRMGEKNHFSRCVVGISEHTSGGGQIVDRYRSAGLRVPVVAVYRDALKAQLETGLGTSQSVVGAIMRILEAPLAGKRVLLIGYGRVGQGLATVLRALGARVRIAEKESELQLNAHLRGFRVTEIKDAIFETDICITTTGASKVLRVATLHQLPQGMVLANVSDKADEIDTAGCRFEANIGNHLASWVTPAGLRFYLLAQGQQVNHVFGGNPAELMDLSFSVHALVVCWLAQTQPSPGLYSVPSYIRQRVISLVLRKMIAHEKDMGS